MARHGPTDAVSALAALLAPGGTLCAACRFSYELRLHRARGYGALVLQLAQPAPEPGTDDVWVRTGRHWSAHLGDSGVVLRVQQEHGGWRFYSAFRPSRYPHRDHACPPRNATCVQARRKISALWARQLLAKWREERP